MSILSKITGEFGCSALNFPLKTICNNPNTYHAYSCEFSSDAENRLRRWKTRNGEVDFRFSDTAFSLFTLLQALCFNSFRKISKQLRQRQGPTCLILPLHKAPFRKISKQLHQKVGPTVLYYLFVKLLFGKPGSEFAIEKVGPICQLSLLITLCENLTSDFETLRG